MTLKCFLCASTLLFLSAVPLASHAATSSSVMIGEVAWAGSSLSTSDEWLELWNTSDTPVAVGGWSLQGAGESGKTIFLPPDAVLAPHGTYLIANYASSDAKSSLAIEPQVVTTTISLSNSSLAITLLDASGTVIDSAGTGDAPPAGASLPIKMSMIRSGDTWVSATSSLNLKAGLSDLATPGVCDECELNNEQTTTTDATTTDEVPILNSEQQATNTAAIIEIPAPTESVLKDLPPKPAYGLLRLNEIDANPTSGKEWIELTTLDVGNAIALDGCTIHDAKNRILTITKATLDPHSSRYILIQLSGSHLNNDGDTVSLYDPAGQLIDTMTYGKSTKGTTWIRFPDVTGNWQQTLQPTPGVANVFVAETAPTSTEPQPVEEATTTDPLPETDAVEEPVITEPIQPEEIAPVGVVQKKKDGDKNNEYKNCFTDSFYDF